jgi:hypothetical protein
LDQPVKQVHEPAEEWARQPARGQQDSNGGDANAYGGDAKAGNGSDATQSNAS